MIEGVEEQIVQMLRWSSPHVAVFFQLNGLQGWASCSTIASCRINRTTNTAGQFVSLILFLLRRLFGFLRLKTLSAWSFMQIITLLFSRFNFRTTLSNTLIRMWLFLLAMMLTFSVALTFPLIFNCFYIPHWIGKAQLELILLWFGAWMALSWWHWLLQTWDLKVIYLRSHPQATMILEFKRSWFVINVRLVMLGEDSWGVIIH